MPTLFSLTFRSTEYRICLSSQSYSFSRFCCSLQIMQKLVDVVTCIHQAFWKAFGTSGIKSTSYNNKLPHKCDKHGECVIHDFLFPSPYSKGLIVSLSLELDPIKYMTYHLSMTQHFILWICFFLKQWVLGVPQDCTLFEMKVSYCQSARSARQKIAGSVELLLLWASGYCLGFRSIYHIHF